MEDVISTHFPQLNTPIIEPALRSSDEHHTLALIVASSTLREQLREQFGDQADVRVCLAITAAVVAELAAVRRDAERYRWLRTQPVFFGWEHDYPPTKIDAEVDYAIEQAELRKGRK
jgi:hypothetical protein